MCASVVEVDFPRGGGPATANGHHQPVKRGGVFGGQKRQKAPPPAVPVPKKQKHFRDGSADSEEDEDDEDEEGSDQEAEERRAPAGEYSNIFRQHLSADMLVEDVRGLGIVKEIGETYVILEAAEGIQLNLAGDRISRAFTQSLIAGGSEADVTLDSLFAVGQAVAFKVVRAAESKGRRARPEVSTCPHDVNSHLVVSSFTAGLVVNGAVRSVEEKGAVIDLGLPNSKVSGFVQRADLPPYLSLEGLHTGQVILFRVKSMPQEGSRAISLSAFPEMDTFEAPGAELRLNQLMPGCVLMAHPEKIVHSGAFVKLNNELTAFIHKIHLPPRVRFDPSKFTKPIRCCVLCCQQNSPLLVVGAHPDLVAMSHLEKRLLPEAYSVGRRVNCVVDEIDKQCNVYFHFDSAATAAATAEGEKDGNKAPLLTAKALRIHIDDVEKSISSFTPGSTHQCRIIGYSAVERVVLVSTKLSTLSAKIISPSDAKPGQKVSATIVSIKPNGLKVQLGEKLFGYITTIHTNDSAVEKGWEKPFIKGQKIPCRVLFFDTTTRRLILTTKPCLVQSQEKPITTLSPQLVGRMATGVVVKVLESGGLIIGFYNRVVGLLKASTAKHLNGKAAKLGVGTPLRVRVQSVHTEKAQMILDFGESKEAAGESSIQTKETSTSTTTSATTPASLKKRAKPFGVSKARVVGPWPYGGTSPHTSALLLLAGGSIGRLHASELEDVEKGCSVGQVLMKNFLLKSIGRMLKVKVICVGKPNTITKDGRSLLMEEHKTDRFVECTLNRVKMAEQRKKLRLINYNADFLKGDRISAFVLDSELPTSKGHISGEVNPLVRVIISAKCLPVGMLESTSGPIFSPGELVRGRVVGVNKTKRGRCVELSLQNDGTVKEEVEEEAAPLGDEQLSEAVVMKSPNKVEDPGFDWALNGFSMADLAKVNQPKEGGAEEESSCEGEEEGEKSGDEDEQLQLLDDNPHSAQPWIRSIAFFAAKRQYAKVRKLAERALQSISSQHENELFSVWVAYLNVEVMDEGGTDKGEGEERLKAVFMRACSAMDSLKMHKQLLAILKRAGKEEEVIELFESMLKKFRHRDLEVWYSYAEHLFEAGEASKARELLQRALQSIEKKQHVAVLIKFAQMEYKAGGDAERGKTIFEKLLHTYGQKKLHIWVAYADMALKFKGVAEARQVFQRAVAENAESGKLKPLFKKWMEVEERHGDQKSINEVRELAAKQVEELKKKL